MNPILKNILSVVVGWFSGSVVNMGLVMLGHKVFPLPDGVDSTDMEALAEIMPTLGSAHFIFPFLAHALGTLIGAFVAYKIAATHKMKFAFGIGALFLIGGIMVNMQAQGPVWFAPLDLIVAYLPMAWLGGKMGERTAKD